MKKLISLALSLFLIIGAISGTFVFPALAESQTTSAGSVSVSVTAPNISLMDETKWGISARDTNATITKANNIISVNDIQWDFFYIPLSLEANTEYKLNFDVKSQIQLEKLRICPKSCGVAHKDDGDHQHGAGSAAILYKDSNNDELKKFTSANTWYENNSISFTTKDETEYNIIIKTAAQLSGATASTPVEFKNMYVSKTQADTIYNLIATAEGNGSVSVSKDVAGVGETVTFTATPDNGEAFTGWYSGEQLLSNATTYDYTIPAEDKLLLTAKFTAINISLMDETKWGISGRDTNATITKANNVISVNDVQWNFFYIPMSLEANTTYELVFDVKSQIQMEKFRICPKSCGVGYKDDGDHQHGSGSAAILYKDSGNEPLNSFVSADTWYENNVISFTTTNETDYYIIIKTGSQLSGAAATTPMEFKNMYVRTLPKSYNITQITDKYKTQGRTTVLNDLLMIDYAASGIEFNANCYGDVSVTFNSTYLPEGEGGGCYFTVIVDDKVMPRDFCHITNKGEVTLNIATDLAYGEHNFKIYRQSEMQYATIGIKSISLRGEILEAPAQNDLYIEFVGASSTNGFGNLGTADIKDQETAQLPIYQDATQAHSYLTAKALGADYSIVAWQGCGAKYTWQPMNMLTAYNYQRYLKDQTTLYDFQRQPDIVVVELSANDFTRANSLNTDSDPSNDVTEQQVIDGLVELGTLIRAKNPDAKVLWIAGSNGTNSYPLVSAAIETLGGAANNYFSLKVTSNIDGAKTHPSVEGHKVIANEVTAYIAKNLLGNTFVTSAEVKGNGKATASIGFALEGDTVDYLATADEEEEFLGWYVNDTLVSTNTEYSHTFTAEGTVPTAKFTTYNLMKAELWKTSPRDTNATVELSGDTVAINEIQWNFFYIPVHLKANTYYTFDFNFRSQIQLENLRICAQSCGLDYNADGGHVHGANATDETKNIIYQDSTYGTNLKNFVNADTWYNNNSVTFKTKTDTDYNIIIKTAGQLSGATATTPVEFSNAAIKEALKTAVILTDEKTGRKGNAAIRAAGDAEGGVAKNGIRIYNGINKQFITDYHIIEYGSIVISADKLQNPDALSLETENIKQGLAFRKYETENGLAKEAVLWKEDGFKNVFTSYLTNIKAENYGNEYLVRSYAISSTGTVYYGDVISACIYDVVYAIDNDEAANNVSINAFNTFVNKNRDNYSAWCTENGYQTGLLFNKEN